MGRSVKPAPAWPSSATSTRRRLGAKHLILFAVFLGSAFVAPAGGAQTTKARPEIPADGKLVQSPGQGPILEVQGKLFHLSARTAWLFHTLQDKRLANREIRVEGEWQPDGTLKVNHVFTVRDGKLYRIRYFCEVCNIEALGPGNCVCCQQPTEMQEIPVDARSQSVTNAQMPP
jgi:hypothetical protein